MYCSSSDLKNVFKKKLLEEVMECIEEAVPQEKSRSSSRKHSARKEHVTNKIDGNETNAFADPAVCAAFLIKSSIICLNRVVY